MTNISRGERKKLELPLRQHGTHFQQSVWRALLDIPYGTSTTYGEIAKSLGNEKAVRAVGSANGKNNIPILIPCHRVVGHGGICIWNRAENIPLES